MPEINFFSEDISFYLEKSSVIKTWILSIAQQEGFEVDTINYVFCSDDYLLGINRQFLQHDYYTDIITFDNSEVEKTILADIFISIDRINDNSTKLQRPFVNELNRVIVHGLLHLLGWSDKSQTEQTLMRQKEDACLSLLK